MTPTSDHRSNAQVQTDGGAHIRRDVTVEGDFVGRDHITAGGDVIINPTYQVALPIPVAKPPVYVNVPAMPGHFLGRDEPIEQTVGKMLAKSQLRLALQGLPGVGKTTLAVAVAHHPDVLRHFQNGILWGGLGQHPDVMGILATWAQELGRDITRVAQEEERAKAVKATIGQQQLLLIIDDAWELAAAQLLCCGGPNCVHLLTTRNQTIGRNFVTGGQVETLPTLDDETAFALLQILAPEACATDPATARKLVERLGGLPLAIELLGGYLAIPEHSFFPELSKEALAELTDPRRRLQLAQKRLGSSTGKEETLQQTIALSLDGLAVEEVRAFYALGAFAPKPQSFDRTAALFVTQTTLSTLAKLIARNLVEKLQDEGLTLHQTIADVAHSQTEPATIERHCRFYLDGENRTIGNIGKIHAQQGNWQVAIQLYEEHLQRKRAANDRNGEDAAILNMGRVYSEQGNWQVTIQLYEDHLRLRQQQAASDSILFFLRELGHVYRANELWEAAIARYTEALHLGHQLGERNAEGRILNNLGTIYKLQQRWEDAIRVYQASLLIKQEIGNLHTEGITLKNIGDVYHEQGKPENAIIFWQEALSKLHWDSPEHQQVTEQLLTYPSLTLIAVNEKSGPRPKSF